MVLSSSVAKLPEPANLGTILWLLLLAPVFYGIRTWVEIIGRAGAS